MTYSDAVVLVIDDVDFAFPAAVRSVPWHSEDPAEFEAADLRYCHFPSRVTFSVGDAVVMGPRSMVPLFDFLAVLALSLKDLRAGGPGSLTFTESADRVELRPVGAEAVEVVYAEACSEPGRLYHRERVKARTTRSELVNAFASFVEYGRGLLIDNAAGFERNPHIGALSID
ncbi:hypothetical protein [Actinoplanes xinjiangensis]|uniref:Uncharacterized protein n=1 Tax=Actinoplanes xinjiangensis TaxID=512350 RepID=A0A316EL53_9ACTN|nr:hypothetical protein [Actinoplanes xinjiangensis]PWK31030.1 hypothetical protein BC793_13527 [Actinoplanes xinjiangensis]GIF44199.1 hypothetical protein Axi01nite_85100 [Actinoplanes xinjiangensis]